MDKVAEFMHIKQRIESLGQDIARSEGVQASLMGTLKDSFQCDSLEGAEQLLVKLGKQIEELTVKRDSTFEKLQAVTDWTKL